MKKLTTLLASAAILVGGFITTAAPANAACAQSTTDAVCKVPSNIAYVSCWEGASRDRNGNVIPAHWGPWYRVGEVICLGKARYKYA